MVKRMQGEPWHVTYLKSKDERRHKSRCAYFKPKNECILNGLCGSSSHCAYYKEKEKYISQNNYEYKDQNVNFIPRNQKFKSKSKNKEVDLGRTIVKIGSFFTVEDIFTKETFEYEFVSPEQEDIFNSKISNKTPLGKAAENKCVGEKVKIRSDIEYRIIEINLK